MHTAYRFENDQWFNIPEDTWLQLTHMIRDYQSQKRQHTNAVSGTNSQCQQKRQFQQTYSYYQPVPETIIQVPPQPHGSIPPTPPPRKSKKTHDDDFSTMTQGTMGASIMGGRNEQASLRSRNTNGRNISNMHTHRRVGHENAVTEQITNTTGSNEAYINAYTCCLVQNFTPIAYKNLSADVYSYSEAYEPVENEPIVSGDTAYDHTDGNTYILVLHEYLYYGSQMKHSLSKTNQIRSHGVEFYDNPDRDEEVYVELDDNLDIPLQFKGTKFTFLSRVTTRK